MKCRVPSSGRTILAVSVQLALLSFCGAAQAAEDATLPAIDVRAVGEVANGPVQGYVAKRSATATKTDTPITEVSQSISVVGQDEIKARGAQDLRSALQYTPGVNASSDDARYDLVAIRGMETYKYRDGLRAIKTGSFGDAGFDLQGLERIEVLKGPASVLYGQSAPGGIVNQVSKRPSLDALNEVSLTAGMYDRVQGGFDIGGAVNSDKTVLFRLNGMVRDSKTEVDHAKDNRRFFAPSLSFQLAERTKLTLLADRLEVRGTPVNFGLTDFLSLPTLKQGKVARSWFLGEPDFDKYDRDDSSVALLLEHGFGDWKLNSSVRKGESNVDYLHVYADDLRADGRTLERGALGFKSNLESLVMDTNVQGKVQTGAVAHTLLFGIDYQNADYVHDYAGGITGTLDLYAPVYGSKVQMGAPRHETQKLRQLGFYAQDQMHLGSWVANLGLRHDTADTETHRPGLDAAVKDSEASYNVGLLYKLPGGVSPYVSYATSFNPVTGFGFGGTVFKPEAATQIEAGVKFQPAGYNALLTMSVFQLRNENVSTEDRAHPGETVQTGEVQTRGLELEAKASLSRQLDLTAAYSLYDTKVSKSGAAAELNSRPPATNRHTASLWADYRFAAGELKGWGAGLGVRAQSSAAGGYWTKNTDAGFAMLDAALSYQKGPVSVRLVASNLTDRETTTWGKKFYGTARKASATVTYVW